MNSEQLYPLSEYNESYRVNFDEMVLYRHSNELVDINITRIVIDTDKVVWCRRDDTGISHLVDKLSSLLENRYKDYLLENEMLKNVN